jgi:MoaA/NifB/PqqE/SkfB family radical SAM enzyme
MDDTPDVGEAAACLISSMQSGSRQRHMFEDNRSSVRDSMWRPLLVRGERKDFFEILEYARLERQFCVKLKTNAIMIHERQAAKIRDIGVESIQISIYSHRPEVHDAITLVPGSLQRSLDAARFLKSQGLRVIFANGLMVQNLQDYQG